MSEPRRLYYQNGFGQAWQCTCADAIHIQFGNVAVLLNHSQLRDFATYITHTLADEGHVKDAGSRDIYIPTRDLALMFAMTYSELQMLDEILNQTLLTITIDNILSN